MQQEVLVNTTSGKLRGFEHRGVRYFLGIPYATPPVGDLRFKKAHPAKPWSGVREAKSFGASAMQNDIRATATGSWIEVLSWMYPRTGSPLEGGPMSEDCLYLNVWTPAETQSGGLPVMVWFHGGGFVQGSGGEMLTNGDRLAARQDVVVVTVNHRLGVLGYMPLDLQFGEEFAHAGVAGLTDLVLALEWVRDNISFMGGDPENVTIFGQSGGGAKVCMMMAMPSARGLFHRAVVQSGGLLRPMEQEEGLRLLHRFLKTLRLSSTSGAEKLRDIPVERLLEAQAQLPSASEPSPFQAPWSQRISGGVMSIAPFKDELLPSSLFDPGPSDEDNRTPLLVGTMLHDASLMLCSDPAYATLTESQLGDWLSPLHADTRNLLKLGFEGLESDPPRLRLAQAISQLTFRRWATQLAQARLTQSAAVYMYLIAYRTPILDGLLGATHSLDLPFVFDNAVRSPFAGDRRDREEFATLMSHTWATFARHGAPNHSGMPSWPRYDHPRCTQMVLDVQPHLRRALL